MAFFHMNSEAFLKQNCFFNDSVCFFASGILEDGSVAFFSDEFISFFWNRIVFSMMCWFFWLQAFWKTVLWPFFI